jgi:DNA-binding CsgD family transcriptional regulator
LVCKQLSTKEIAAMLFLSKRTVEGYRSQIQEKIGAKNSIGIALYAFINEIVLPCRF